MRKRLLPQLGVNRYVKEIDMTTLNSEIVETACDALGRGNISAAKNIIANKYPFKPLQNAGRKYSEHQKIKVFLRDGFIDRYSGDRMIFPPVLRLLSELMPDEFPFQKNWKMSECHIGYWQLLPTVDHIIPVSRGGEDQESNMVCTSQLRNSAKANWLLEELGWLMHEPGSASDWDGLMAWFMAYAENKPDILDDSYMRSWYRAANNANKT